MPALLKDNKKSAFYGHLALAYARR